jgi:prevent-host-death family protein
LHTTALQITDCPHVVTKIGLIVMGKTIHKKPSRAPGGNRMGVADAKARLSAVLRRVADGPVVAHSRDRDVAVVLGVEDYDRLVSARTERRERCAFPGADRRPQEANRPRRIRVCAAPSRAVA